ncbi:MAG: flagellar biosynthesis anti-sigma factor FlgM [Dehalococcoidia bacterium]|nr:flagellar biosynthesis anti-sigma factor FlgM [Dehalococcoidia bacterium]
MPDEQERRTSKRRVSDSTHAPGGTAPRDRASTTGSTPAADEGDGAGPREPVDFRAAAQRLTARAAYIAQLKADVEGGTYRADADETARAMDRRSDS